MKSNRRDVGVQKTDSKHELQAPVLLEMEGTYLVAPGTTVENLCNDAGGWLQTIGANIDTTIDLINYQSELVASNLQQLASVLYGIRHHISMVRGALNAISKLEMQA